MGAANPPSRCAQNRQTGWLKGLPAVLFALWPIIAWAQPPARPEPAHLLAALLSEDPSASLCVEDSARALSGRLGIRYAGVACKSLISYELDEPLKARLRAHPREYTTSWQPCSPGIERFSVAVPSVGITRDFYFRDDCLTSPFFCLTVGWTTRTSRFFRFVMSDSTLTNAFAIQALDDFVLRTGVLFGFTDADFATLEDAKILYYLCKDEDEILQLTGFRTRGIYNLAYDAIVSTNNAHFHELTHLLMNYALRETKVYANPFLQEGVAVALGGRGGISADVLLQLGAFLHESSMLEYTSILGRAGFSQYDASLSYPIAGTYTRFLIESLGFPRFLDLYRRHCGNPGDSLVEAVSLEELPAQAEWEQYLAELSSARAIQFPQQIPDAPLVWDSGTSTIHAQNHRFYFNLSDTLLFGERDSTHTWKSRLFAELFAGAEYTGQHYAAMADSQSVSLYDLWTNTLMASYNAAFELAPMTVPRRGTGHLFSVSDTLFAKPLTIDGPGWRQP